MTRTLPLGTSLELNGQRRRWFSYDDIESLALHYRRQVLAGSYDAIVGVARGGLYLSTMLSQMTKIPHTVARYDASSREVSLHDREMLVRARRVLVVDDVAGKSRALFDVQTTLLNLGLLVDTMVVCAEPQSEIRPDYGIELSAGEQHLFPWERPQLETAQSARSRFDDEPSDWVTAFDLDGVFLPDLPAKAYTRDFRATLEARDKLPALPQHPFWNERGIIISARLVQDRDRTLRWLRSNQIWAARLVLRQDSAQTPLEYKKASILQLNITEYVESDLQVAKQLAQLRHVVIWHYDHEKRQNTRIVP